MHVFPDNESLITHFYARSLPLITSSDDSQLAGVKEQLSRYREKLNQLKNNKQLTSDQKKLLKLEFEIFKVLAAAIAIKSNSKKTTTLPEISHLDEDVPLVKTMKTALRLFHAVFSLPYFEKNPNGTEYHSFIESSVDVIKLFYQNKSSLHNVLLGKGNPESEQEVWYCAAADNLVEKLLRLRGLKEQQENFLLSLQEEKAMDQRTSLSLQKIRDSIIQVHVLLRAAIGERHPTINKKLRLGDMGYNHSLNKQLEKIKNKYFFLIDDALKKSFTISSTLSLLSYYDYEFNSTAVITQLCQSLLIRLGQIYECHDSYQMVKTIDEHYKHDAAISEIHYQLEKFKFDLTIIQTVKLSVITDSELRDYAKKKINGVENCFNMLVDVTNNHLSGKAKVDFSAMDFEDIISYEQSKLVNAFIYLSNQDLLKSSSEDEQPNRLNDQIATLILLIEQLETGTNNFSDIRKQLAIRFTADYCCHLLILLNKKDHYRIFSHNTLQKIAPFIKNITDTYVYGWLLSFSSPNTHYTHIKPENKNDSIKLRNHAIESFSDRFSCSNSMILAHTIKTATNHLLHCEKAKDTSSLNKIIQKIKTKRMTQLNDKLSEFSSTIFYTLFFDVSYKHAYPLSEKSKNDFKFLHPLCNDLIVYNASIGTQNDLTQSTQDIIDVTYLNIQNHMINDAVKNIPDVIYQTLYAALSNKIIIFENYDHDVLSFIEREPRINLSRVLMHCPLNMPLISRLSWQYLLALEHEIANAIDIKKTVVINHAVKQITRLVTNVEKHHVAKDNLNLAKQLIVDLFVVIKFVSQQHSTHYHVMNSNTGNIIKKWSEDFHNSKFYAVVLHSESSIDDLLAAYVSFSVLYQAQNQAVNHIFIKIFDKKLSVLQGSDNVDVSSKEAFEKISSLRKSLLNKAEKNFNTVSHEYQDNIRRHTDEYKKIRVASFIPDYQIPKRHHQSTSNKHKLSQPINFDLTDKSKQIIFVDSPYETISQHFEDQGPRIRDFYKKYIDSRLPLNKLHALLGLIECLPLLKQHSQQKLIEFIETRADNIFQHARNALLPAKFIQFQSRYQDWKISRAELGNPVKSVAIETPQPKMVKPVANKNIKASPPVNKQPHQGRSKSTSKTLHTVKQTVEPVVKQPSVISKPLLPFDGLAKGKIIKPKLSKTESKLIQSLRNNGFIGLIQGATPLDTLLDIKPNDLDLVIFGDKKRFKQFLQDNKDKLGILEFRQNKQVLVFVLTLKSIDSKNETEEVEIHFNQFTSNNLNDLDEQVRTLARNYGINLIYADIANFEVLDPLKQYKNLFEHHIIDVGQVLHHNLLQYLKDEPIRILHAMYKRSRYQYYNKNFKFGDTLDEALRGIADSLTSIDLKKNISQSLFDKLFTCGYSVHVIDLLEKYHLTPLFFPSLPSDTDDMQNIIGILKVLDGLCKSGQRTIKTKLQIRLSILDLFYYHSFEEFISETPALDENQFYKQSILFFDNLNIDINWEMQNQLQDTWYQRYLELVQEQKNQLEDCSQNDSLWYTPRP